jgi:hypothetical protein
MVLSPDEIARRKKLTLGQVEGWEALPSQLEKGEVSDVLRVAIVDFLNQMFDYHHDSNTFVGPNPGYLFAHLWSKIEVKPLRSMPQRTSDTRNWFTRLAEDSGSQDFYSAVDHILRGLLAGIGVYDNPDNRHISGRYKIARAQLARIMSSNLAPYRIHEEGFLFPVVDDLTVETVTTAIKETGLFGGGVKAHFRKAIEFLNAGDFAKSARESWDTLESCVTQLGGNKASFADSLRKLVNDGVVPRFMGDSWNKILAYVNDTPGIRHALQAGEKSQVEEAQAIYMLSVSGAAVTYLRSAKTKSK